MPFYKYIPPNYEIRSEETKYLWRGEMTIVYIRGKRFLYPPEVYPSLAGPKYLRKHKCVWRELDKPHWEFICYEGKMTHRTTEHDVTIFAGKSLCNVDNLRTGEKNSVNFEGLLKLVGIFEIPQELILDENENFYFV